MAKNKGLSVSDAVSIRLPDEVEKGKKSYFETGNSVSIDLIQKTWATSSNLALMAKRQAEISHNDKKIEIIENVEKGQIKVRQQSDNYTTELTLFYQSMKKLPQSAKKILRFIVTKITDEAFSNNKLTKDSVSFYLDDLIKNEIYKNADTARVGFKTASKALVDIAIEGRRTQGKGKNKQDYIWSYGHLFRRASILNGKCIVELETDNDWNFVISNYEIMPNYCYGLPNRSYDLAEAIFYFARINNKEIADNGFFSLSLKVLQQRLALPEETPNPGRDIKKPIEDAISSLNNAESETQNYKIEIFADKNTSPNQWIDNGYIKVFFFNEYLNKFKQLAEKRNVKILQQQIKMSKK